MKIAINGRFLIKPHTGIGVYTRQLFSALARQFPDSELVMFTPSDPGLSNPPQAVARGEVKFTSNASAFPANVKIVVLPENFPGTGGMRKTYWEQVQVPAAMSKIGADIAHFPYPSNPWLSKIARKIIVDGDKIERKICPVVVTVHDVIPWTLPAYRKSVSTRLYQDRCMRAVARADGIVTVSEASKKEISRVCGISAKRIKVIPNAPPPAFFNKFSPHQILAIFKRYGISQSRPYFLYSGGYDARKNVGIIVKTWLKKIAPNFKVDLVLAGGKSHQTDLYSSYDLTNFDLGHSLKSLKGKIILTGFVKDEDFPVLYQFCSAFINLSRSEGFNLPLLEAAVSGAPIVTSDIPVHREIAGSHAEFCHPDDVKKLGAIMEKFASDKSFLQSKKKMVKKYKCPYSWEKSAIMLMQLYKQLT
jgi:glycosyltransferase involved in cell wall biosynthesis